MRYIRFITALLVLMMTESCIDGLDEPLTTHKPGDNSIQVYARITNFSDKTVDTRSAKSPEEARVSSMALAIFPIEGDAIQPCIDYYYEVGQKVNFTIDRSEQTYDEYGDKPFAMYIFANIPNDASIGKGKGLDAFKSLVHSVSAVYYADADFTGLPDSGFPMMGSLGDSNVDGKTLILKPDVSNSNPHSLPLVNNSPSDLLNIPMESMYAKFSFAITLNPTQTIDSQTQSFTMESYTLHNIPSSVDFKAGTNDDDDVLADEITINDNSVTVEGGSGEGSINFSFYVPERYLSPATSAAAYNYPFKQDNTIRDEDMHLRQRYKPKLLGDGQKATYVTIKGKYLDHNNRTWAVSYDIYLGADNYGDFNIIRNTHYSNSIEIRGVTNSVDMAEYENTISIDHRVNIVRSLPIIESLRRETLLDSHFEVRPLRIRAVEGQEGKTVTVSVQPNDGTYNIPDWIRLEHKNDATAKNGYNDYLDNGKRKYFTYGLVSGKAYDGSTEANNLSASTSVSFESRTTNDCVWIYVDECPDVYGLNDDGSVNVEPRSAKIVVTVEGESTKSEYVINQSKLYPIYNVGSSVPDYLIESYEEYLYNYDAEDTYTANKTHFEGMAWGLDGVQLSNKHMAADPSKADNMENYDKLRDAGKTTMQNNVNSYYDFYNEEHDSDIPTPDQKHTRAGQHFCNEIIVTANIDDSIGSLTLNGQPTGAVEYCYNRNKRNRSGSVASTDWYLPAIDEIEDIMVSAYNAFDGVFQSQDYWSCQPSYHRCYFFMSWNSYYTRYYLVRGNFDFYIDDTRRARSTKAEFNGKYDQNGNPQYTYNSSGVEVPEDLLITGDGNPYPNGVKFTIQRGYYTWRTQRGDKPAKGHDENGNWTEYDYVGAYIGGTTQDKTILPAFGEDQYRQDGSRPRTELNRVRCVRKID